MKQRVGITAAGNWIVDRVKRVDCLPGRGMLANIKDQMFSPGGAPANVREEVINLAHRDLPLTMVMHGKRDIIKPSRPVCRCRITNIWLSGFAIIADTNSSG
jgi:hypothetical protein